VSDDSSSGASAALHVAVATDMAYLPWCAVALLSCQRATVERRVHVHVLHEGDLSREAQCRLGGMVRAGDGEVSYHVVSDDRMAPLPSKGPDLGGRTSWIRIFLPEMLPDLDRILYLDADTMTIRSVSPLWTAPLDGAPVAAVSNVVEPARHAHVAQLGIGDPRSYFNAGVLVMNLAVMREERTLDRIINAVATRHDRLPWFDQDALNVVFADRWQRLHPRWNAQNSLWLWEPWARHVFGEDERRDAVSSPAILHFEGPSFVKPWHYLCRHPFRDRYHQTLAATPWREEPLRGRTPVTRIIRCLPPPLQLPAYVRLLRVKARRAG
jgi:lipopolysaccharide biosynthesis glycosyltransferase